MNVTSWKEHSYQSCRHEVLLAGSTYGDVWRGDESPLQIIAQRCALHTHLRGEAPECTPKQRTFMIRCSSLAVAVDLIRRRPSGPRISCTSAVCSATDFHSNSAVSNNPRIGRNLLGPGLLAPQPRALPLCRPISVFSFPSVETPDPLRYPLCYTAPPDRRGPFPG